MLASTPAITSPVEQKHEFVSINNVGKPCSQETEDAKVATLTKLSRKQRKSSDDVQITDTAVAAYDF